MKKKNNQRKSMDAIQYFNKMNETQNIMESIAAKTDSEQSALLENGNPYGDTNDNGLFDMDRLLDVNLKDFNDTPKVYNSPVPELTNGDKSLISDEFAKQLMNTKADTIDLEHIGPMSTAIAMKNGFLVTSVEDFIRQLIETSAEKQDSQSIALGLEEVPGVKELEMGNEPEMVEPPVVADVTLITPEMDTVPAVEEMPAEMAAPEAPVVPELPLEEPAAAEPDLEPEMDAAPAADVDLEKEHADMAQKLEDKAKADGDTEAAKLAGDLKEGELKEVEDLSGGETPAPAAEETEEVGLDLPEEMSDEEEDKKLESKLESIKASYKNKVILEATEKALENKLETIKSKYLAESATPVAPVTTETPKVEEKAVEAVVEAAKVEEVKAVVEEVEMTVDDAGTTTETSDEDLFETAQVQLESLLNDFLSNEEAVEKETKLVTQLESIATGYKEEKKAEKEAADKDAKVVAQLESITENFKKNEAGKLDSKKKAKARLDELKK